MTVLILSHRYAFFLTGSAIVSIPNSTQSATIGAGKNGLVFAADTAAVSSTGHITAFLEDTILIQIPLRDGVAPKHTILHDGGCRGEDLA